MSTVLFVLGSNIHWAPYYYKYESLMIDNGIQFDLLLWNREQIYEKTRATNVLQYMVPDVSNNKNPLKLFKFIRFAKYTYNVLQEKEYKKIIFLGTHGCAAVFNAIYLKKNYSGKYWLDIRDYQYEWFYPFKFLEKILIKYSYCTSISSYGYRKFLPKHDYIISHNIDSNIKLIRQKYFNEKNNKIRIGFVGNIRYINMCKELINLFKNDDRYILCFYGDGSSKIQEYCKRNCVSNVDIFGRFPPVDTVNFYNKIDIINNVYGNSSIGLTTALSNKLYYAVYLRLPIMVCKNTYMETYCKKHGFSITYENSIKFKDDLYSWYKEFKNNKDNIFKNIEREITNEDELFCEQLIKFVKG